MKPGLRRRVQSARVLLTGTCLFALGACDGILNVDDSGIIVPGDLDAAGTAAVPALVNGMVGNYHSALGSIIRYAAMLTDEMIMSETFETNLQVDRRRILVNNASLTGSLYTPIHRARLQADTTVVLLQRHQQNPAFDTISVQLTEGIALGKLYGGYTRIWLAELYCWSILTGMFPEEAPVLPNDRMRDALIFLEQAEGIAAAAGLANIRLAAITGQARAHLWLRNFATAAILANQVPRDFTFRAEYSNNNPGQYNELYAVTWGDAAAIRMTVGDGTSSLRGNERWEHFDRFVALNLLRVRPSGFTAFVSSIPVNLQMLYNRPDREVLVASGVEAQLIRAEAAVRAGQTSAAATLLNDLRSDYSLRATIRWGVTPPTGASGLDSLTLTGNLRPDVKRVADERARELWLTGDRQTTSRRLRRDPLFIDLYPPVKTGIGGGDDVAFPIVQLELDANPRLSLADACPAGQQAGSWR